MSHDEWIDRMLEADPAELVGEGATPLAAHVRECERCRSLGRRLVEEQTRLARALEEARPRGTAAEAVERVLAERASGTRRFRWGVVLVPLSVAAAVAALLLWMPGEEGYRPAGPPPSGSPPAPARLSVDVPEGGAVVFATRDPAVTLVWIDRPEGETR